MQLPMTESRRQIDSIRFHFDYYDLANNGKSISESIQTLIPTLLSAEATIIIIKILCALEIQ